MRGASEASRLPPGRLHGLDGLRALASLLVLVHHLGAPRLALALVQKGHAALGFFIETVGGSGVELFFILSGALLVRPFLRGNRQFRSLDYARRRAVRIFPPYFVAWLVTGLSFYINPWQGAFRWPEWVAQVAIVHFGVHYAWAWWSLTTEVLFYFLVPLLIPALLMLPRRLSPQLAVLAGSAAVALSLPWLPSFARLVPYEVLALVVYLPCFAVGLILARVDFPAGLAYAIGAVGALLLLTAAFVPALSERLRHVGYGFVYTCIVARTLLPETNWSRQLGRWHLVWMGERSYSLFLIHCAVLMFVGRAAVAVGQTRSVAFRVIVASSCIALSVFAAMLLFSFVERRFAHGLATADAFWPLRRREASAKISAKSLSANN